MTTFSDMYNRIADELFRPDLLPQIKLAINSAVAELGDERFYFNEYTDIWNTVVGQEYYTFSGTGAVLTYDPVKIDILRITRPGGTVYDLNLVDFFLADDIQANPANTGTPYQWSTYNNQFRLFPIPNQVFPIKTYYAINFPPLINPTDTNPWLVAGEAATRLRAKADVVTNVIRDPENGLIYHQMGKGELKNLYQSTTNRLGTGRMRPTQF